MRYLKLYESFNDFETIKKDIEHILVDLSDKYIPIDVSNLDVIRRQQPTFSKIIVKIGDEIADLEEYTIDTKEIKEDLLCLNDYLSHNGYDLSSFSYDHRGSIMNPIRSLLDREQVLSNEEKVKLFFDIEETSYIAIFFNKRVEI